MYRASYHWWNWKPPAGFRFSFIDAIAIVVCFAVVGVLLPVLGNIVWIIPIVLGHFFLFCNLFRIPRFLELFWSGIFLLNVGFWFSIDQFSWIMILETQFLPTVVIILLAILRKDYHGIGYWLVPWGRRPANLGRQ
jgi:hypothetical protein